ncbi:hypothetical protein [Arthrobacter sp. H14-L1]|uniref:hypothetical protein n=1 Tax=Arthrobacter sp. H14-L1 TaxID=2996697 RepID=UPI00226DD0FD|nr:hypothetical protein [Arthrobacter sp. H14-L1]MCY0905785.1 hypothetical protein [Arthrobacter sp. H14-L1]
MAAAAEASEQLVLDSCKHAVDIAELNTQLAEVRATGTMLRETQDALMARIQLPDATNLARENGDSKKR